MCVSEFDTLSRLGVDDPRAHASARYGQREGVLLLETCCVGGRVVMEVEGALEELLDSGGWVDILVRPYGWLLEFCCYC